MMLSAMFHECLAVMLSLWVDLQEAGSSLGRGVMPHTHFSAASFCKLVAMAIAAI